MAVWLPGQSGGGVTRRPGRIFLFGHKQPVGIDEPGVARGGRSLSAA
jgi:hypothetical protein